jgi:hypothetical protein
VVDAARCTTESVCVTGLIHSLGRLTTWILRLRRKTNTQDGNSGFPSGSVTPEDRKEFAELRNNELKTAGALALEETAMARYNYVYERPARKYFR